MAITIRPITPKDAEPCGRILFEAFKNLADHHRFPPDIPSADWGAQMMGGFSQHPSYFGIVAEQDGQIVGSNFLDQRGPIQGVGPITVDPSVQQRGIGRQLMEAVLEQGKDATGIRLVQDAFNTASIALYASLGFNVVEPLLLIQGKPKSTPPADIEIRPLQEGDIDACVDLCQKIHGIDRRNELAEALPMPMLQPVVAVREGRITAYATGVHFWFLCHGVAETEEDLKALITGAAQQSEEPAMFLLPSRQTDLFRWCLHEGFRVVKPLTLMAMGKYQEPRGSYFPSVLY